MNPSITIAATEIVTPVVTRNRQISAVCAEIDELGRLPIGWRFGEGGPVSEDVRKRAKQLALLGMIDHGLHVSSFPTPDRDIILRFHGRYGDTLEVYVNKDGSYDVALENGYGFDFEVVFEQDDVDLETLESHLFDLAWNTPEFSTRGTLTITTQDSTVVSFRTRTGQSLSLVSNVPTKRLAGRASTYGYSITG